MPPASPPRVSLMQNYPNPVHSANTDRLHARGPDGLGACQPADLQRLGEAGADPGEQTWTTAVPADWSLRWDGLDENGRRQSSGIYYYKLEVQGTIYSKKLVLLR